MNETLLLFHTPSRPELLKIQRALLPLHIRLRCISQKDYLQPLGFLAGMKNFSPTTEVYDGEELSAPLFLFCFFQNNRLDQALAALRRCGAGPFPYKAILTPTNCEWNALTCFNEVKKEHEQMHK